MPGPTPCPLHLPCRKKLSDIRAVAPHPWTAPAPILLPRRTGEPHNPRVTPSQDPRNGAWWKRGASWECCGNATAPSHPAEGCVVSSLTRPVVFPPPYEQQLAFFFEFPPHQAEERSSFCPALPPFPQKLVSLTLLQIDALVSALLAAVSGHAMGPCRAPHMCQSCCCISGRLTLFLPP